MDEVGSGAARPHVEAFRQIVVWPLQLMPNEGDRGPAWERLLAANGPWRELQDDFPEDASLYQERHYREFVAFLPHVRRFLYGERASGARAVYGESPMRIFRRDDVARLRLFPESERTPYELDVVHVDLYFFYDVDVVILVVEIEGGDMALSDAQEIVYRLGRAYPAGWDALGAPLNCFRRVEWLGRDGDVLSASDDRDRARFMEAVCRRQATALSAHWQWLLAPLSIDPCERPPVAAFRQLEFHRMPIMVYVALDDPRLMTRADAMRLAFASSPGEPDDLPYGAEFLGDFEEKHCWDRFHDPARRSAWTDTRLMCSRQALVVVGDARRPFFLDAERGALAQFRHQFFLVGLIAHFHRASLLMLSDRLVSTMNRLDPTRRESVGRFRHDIRATLEVFLRFTHRYYFSEISDQAPLREVFDLWRAQLGTARLYEELREEISDMAGYLETDLLRRQAVTILQLTVVTLFSQIGMLATGFLGMNIFGWAEADVATKVFIFFAALIPSAGITFYTVLKARRLAFFLDALANEKLDWKARWASLREIWSTKPL
ncbi:MAG: CorA family divalent cation transporter [Hyphomicrobiales bacterium]|nr:CorA family divalent cation transporter [Hyphomicrobiales bacterium]